MPLPADPNAARSLRWFLGAAVFDEATRQLSLDGEPVTLEPRPAHVLLLLLRKHGDVVTHAELREQVWGNRTTVAHVIATAIGKVRHALAEIPELEVVSISRIGYRLSGPVRQVLVDQELPDLMPLQAGDLLSSAAGFRLLRALGEGDEALWIAREDVSGVQALFRIAQTEPSYLRLRLELEQAQALHQTLGPLAALPTPVAANLAEPPFYLRYEYAGLTLAEWGPEYLPGLDGDQRLSLFLCIADPVGALHNVGVLHQSLNARNILIRGAAGAWQPSLINLGRRSLRPSGAPERQRDIDAEASVAMPLRPEAALYLAPELLQAHACTASSEVYALGVLLYQLLIGDLQRAVHPGWERDIPDDLLRKDIAAATDHDAARRIGSVHTLVERLRKLDARRAEAEGQRRLVEELQAAEAREARERARRPWMRAAVVLLVGCTVLAAKLYLEADQRRAAAERLAKSNETVQRFLVEDVFALTNPADPRYKRDASMLDVLDNAASKIDERYADDPLTLGVLHQAIGSSYKGLGNRKVSIAHYRASIPLLEIELGGSSEAALDARYGLAHALMLAAEFEEARSQLDTADQLAGERLRQQHPLALRSAVHRGQLHTHQFRPAEALPNYQLALALLDAGVPSRPELRAVVRHEYADSLLRLNRPDEVISMFASFDDFVSDGQRGSHHRILARAYRAKADYQGALPHAEQAVALLRSAYGDDDWDTLTAISSLSYLQFLLGNCTAAVPLAEEAYQRMVVREGETKQGVLIELGNRGSRRADCGQAEAGIRDLYAARDQLREHYGTTSAPAQSFAMILATHLGKQQRHAEALAVIATMDTDAAAQIQASGGPSVSPATLQVLHARLLHGAGRNAEAVPLLTAALEVLEAPESTDTKLRDEARELLAAVCKGSPAACAESMDSSENQAADPS